MPINTVSNKRAIIAWQDSVRLTLESRKKNRNGLVVTEHPALWEESNYKINYKMMRQGTAGTSGCYLRMTNTSPARSSADSLGLSRFKAATEVWFSSAMLLRVSPFLTL